MGIALAIAKRDDANFFLSFVPKQECHIAGPEGRVFGGKERRACLGKKRAAEKMHFAISAYWAEEMHCAIAIAEPLGCCLVLADVVGDCGLVG